MITKIKMIHFKKKPYYAIFNTTYFLVCYSIYLVCFQNDDEKVYNRDHIKQHAS